MESEPSFQSTGSHPKSFGSGIVSRGGPLCCRGFYTHFKTYGKDLQGGLQTLQYFIFGNIFEDLQLLW